MNLVDVDVTGVGEAFDAVAAEAEMRGLSILDSEIVGLVPEVAPAASRSTSGWQGSIPSAPILERLLEVA